VLRKEIRNGERSVEIASKTETRITVSVDETFTYLSWLFMFIIVYILQLISFVMNFSLIFVNG